MRILIIFISILFLNCSQIYDYYERQESSVDYISNFQFNENVKIADWFNACNWVKDNIIYKKEIGDYWQTPEETMQLKTGDCEDIAILIIAITYNKTKIKMDFVLVNTLYNINTPNHAVCMVNYLSNDYICEQNGVSLKKDYKPYITNIISFDKLSNVISNRRIK
jgi:hypothetical protein